MSSIRFLSVFAVLLGLCGCGTPYRMSAGNYTIVPLRGLGTHLPKEGHLPAAEEGLVYFDSLYVRKLIPVSGNLGVDYLRFWPTGQVLYRRKIIPSASASDGIVPLTARDGDVVDDQLTPEQPQGTDSVTPAIVGRYAIVGESIYIEWFGFFTDETPVFLVEAGPVSSSGLTIARYRLTGGLFPWKPRDKSFVKQQVGEMHGEPTW